MKTYVGEIGVLLSDMPIIDELLKVDVRAIDEFLRSFSNDSQRLKVVKLLVQGYSNKSIAASLLVSESTVNTQIQRTKEKLRETKIFKDIALSEAEERILLVIIFVIRKCMIVSEENHRGSELEPERV